MFIESYAMVSSMDRIDVWESFFEKYQNGNSTKRDYVFSKDSWQRPIEKDNGGLPGGLKTIIDKIWEDDKELVLSHPIAVNDCLDEVKYATNEHCDDDDYDSCLSDSDSGDVQPVPVSNNVFFSALSEISRTRFRIYLERRKMLDCPLDTVLAGQTVRGNKRTAAVSSPIEQGCMSSVKKSSPNTSPVKSVKCHLDGIVPSFSSTVPSMQDHAFSFEKSSEVSPRALKSNMGICERISSTDKHCACTGSSINVHMCPLKTDSLSNEANEYCTPKLSHRTRRASCFCEISKKTDDAVSSRLRSPTDESRKRRTATPQKNCQLQSPSPLSSVLNSSGKRMKVVSSTLQRKINSEKKGIRALKKGFSYFEV